MDRHRRDDLRGGTAPGHGDLRRPPADTRRFSLRPAASRGAGARRLTGTAASRYAWKEIPGSSHDLLRRTLRALPPGGSLLDLGAGPGYLGEALAGHFSHVVGVEEDPASAPAPGAYDRWIHAPIGSVGEWDRPFDVIVCADVLEHLPDPATVLASVRAWIAPGGVLLVSVPNVANAAVRFSLLAGRFEYAEKGILDRTHLRFFTRKSGKQLIENAGFRVVGVRASAVPVELALPGLGRPPLRDVSRGIASAAARIWPTLFGYQFLYEARPA